MRSRSLDARIEDEEMAVPQRRGTGGAQSRTVVRSHFPVSIRPDERISGARFFSELCIMYTGGIKCFLQAIYPLLRSHRVTFPKEIDQQNIRIPSVLVLAQIGMRSNTPFARHRIRLVQFHPIWNGDIRERNLHIQVVIHEIHTRLP